MKMISVPAPSSGVRNTAGSMFPASFRAGMTTEHLNWRKFTGNGRGRATTKTVRQKCFNNGASQRLKSAPSNGVRIGQRMRVSVLMISQPAR